MVSREMAFNLVTGSIFAMKYETHSARNKWSFKTGGLTLVVSQDRFYCMNK